MRKAEKQILIKHTLVNQILTPCGISSIEYSLNPYIGCAHGCAYCYARYLLLRRGYGPEDWGKVVYIKSNAVSRLKDEIRWRRRGKVYLSSATDPYQPVEKEYQITRRLLEILVKYDWPVEILTKSTLILRDLDLIRTISDIRVGVSISVTEDFRRVFEPFASSYDERLRILERLVNVLGGKRVYVFFAPFLPVLSEYSLDTIIDDISNVGIQRLFLDKLNIKAQNWITINKALERIGISKKDFWKKAKDMAYWNKTVKDVIKKAIARRLEVNILF